MSPGNAFGRICLCVGNALCCESLGLESSFLYVGTSSEYSGQVFLSRSAGQGRSRDQKSMKSRPFI